MQAPESRPNPCLHFRYHRNTLVETLDIARKSATNQCIFLLEGPLFHNRGDSASISRGFCWQPNYPGGKSAAFQAWHTLHVFPVPPPFEPFAPLVAFANPLLASPSSCRLRALAHRSDTTILALLNT